MNNRYLFFPIMAVLAFASCNDVRESASATADESAKANEFFERSFQSMLERHPTFQTFLGKKEGLSQWDNISEEFQQAEHEVIKIELQYLQDSIDYNKLDAQTRLSYDIFKNEKEREIEAFEYRHLDYPVNQMSGWHKSPANVLLNLHRVDSLSDAEAYISRVEKLPAFFNQAIENLRIRREKGIILPKYLFEKVIQDCRNLSSGYPLENVETPVNPIFEDFKAKVDSLDISGETRNGLMKKMTAAMTESYAPAYQKLIAYLEDLRQDAGDDVGFWQYDESGAFYSTVLNHTLTTDRYSPEDVFQYGLSEVERIHGEMREIMKKVGFEGTLQDFFQYMKTSAEFYYPDNEEGRQAYLDTAKAVIDQMRERLDDLFITKPKADIVVKRVEAYQENSAGLAYYWMPAPDGSRPGVYYVNLRHMADLPSWEIEALAYHEGIPGHHMQLAITQELDIPEFRKYIEGTAYVEGWGLYSEAIPKEIGFYSNPYSDFGRLSMELFRACRLVVDVGIHYKKWTRDEGIRYYTENTASSDTEISRMVDRHIVWPSQATAYKIGMKTLFDLREEASGRLGEDFDIREFHEAALTHGILPLQTLERVIEDYIDRKSGGKVIAEN